MSPANCRDEDGQSIAVFHIPRARQDPDAFDAGTHINIEANVAQEVNVMSVVPSSFTPFAPSSSSRFARC